MFLFVAFALFLILTEAIVSVEDAIIAEHERERMARAEAFPEVVSIDDSLVEALALEAVLADME